MDDSPIQVLLVEDDPDDAVLLRAMLDEVPSAPVALTHARRLDEALARVAAQRFDAALLDLSLPDSQGLETFVSLHQAQPGLPVVVLTGLNDEVLAMKAVHEGAQDYLVKGQVSGSLLTRSLRYAIVRQRASHYRALLAERERFDTAISQMSDGIVVTESDWRIATANRAASLLLDLPADARAMTLGETLAPFSVSLDVDSLLGGAEPFTAFEVSRTGTHPPLHIDARLSRLFDGAGRLSGAVLVLRDVTDERLARHVQASFITTVPHKLRTPLALLGGYLQLAKHLKPEQLAREWPHVSAVCEAEVESLSVIVQKLLDFEALSTWQLEEVLRHTDVAAVVATVVEKVRDRYPRRQIEVGVDVADAAAFADCTTEHLEFILDELMGNAAKFTVADPVRIRLVVVREEPAMLRFSVTDNGPGIPHEYYDRIFEGFVQVEEHVTGQVPGLGIGLRLVRQVVEACGGSIAVSAQLGVGSAFTFSVPAPPLDPALPAVPSPVLS
jgi:signal transduction histidine kinase